MTCRRRLIKEYIAGAMRRRRLQNFVLLGGVGALFVAGIQCKSGSCDETVVCPVVDEDPASGDLVLTAATGVLVGVSSGSVTGTQVVTGGMAVLEGILPPLAFPDVGSTVTLKRLRLVISDIDGLSTTAGSLDVVNPTLSIAAPITLTFSAGGVVTVPAGTVVHTCATIDGRAWHASSPLPQDLELAWQPAQPTQPAHLLVDSTLPMSLRADDSQCSPLALTASSGEVFSEENAADGGSSDAGED